MRPTEPTVIRTEPKVRNTEQPPTHAKLNGRGPLSQQSAESIHKWYTRQVNSDPTVGDVTQLISNSSIIDHSTNQQSQTDDLRCQQATTHSPDNWSVNTPSQGPAGKAAAPRAYEMRTDPRFLPSSHSGDLKCGTVEAILPAAWRYRVSTSTGWPDVSTLSVTR